MHPQSPYPKPDTSFLLLDDGAAQASITITSDFGDWHSYNLGIRGKKGGVVDEEHV